MQTTNSTGKHARMKPDWTDAFLSAIARNPNATQAAAAAGISRETAYKRAQRDPTFKARWQDALDQAVDALEGKVYDLAMEGNERLLAIALAAYRRDRWGKQAQEVKHSGTVSHQLLGTHLESMRQTLTPEQFAIYAAEFQQRQPAALGDGETLEAEYRVEDEDEEPED